MARARMTGSVKKAKGAAAGTATPSQAQARSNGSPEAATGNAPTQDPDWLPVPVEDLRGYEVHREQLRVRSWRTRGGGHGSRRETPLVLGMTPNHAVTLRVKGATIQFPVAMLQGAALGVPAALESLARVLGRMPRRRYPRTPRAVAEPHPGLARFEAEGEARAVAAREVAIAAAAREALSGAVDGAVRELGERVTTMGARVEVAIERLAIEMQAQLDKLKAAQGASRARPGASAEDGQRGVRSSPPPAMQQEQVLALVAALGPELVAALVGEDARTLRALAQGTRLELDPPQARRLDMAYVAWRSDHLDGVDETYDAIAGRLSRAKTEAKRRTVEARAWSMVGDREVL